MSDKACTRCGKTQPLSEFYKDRREKEGVRAKCKDCVKMYTRAFSQTPARREYERKYSQSPARVKAKRLYDQTPARMEVHRQSARRQYAKYPERVRALYAVAAATKTGIIKQVKSLYCVDCGKQAQQYDHYLGYSEQHQLSVEPVCIRCHRKRHYKIYICHFCGATPAKNYLFELDPLCAKCASVWDREKEIDDESE